MTTDADTTDYTDADLREQFSDVVVSSNGKSNKVLHVPDGDEEEPLCGVALISKEWVRKSVDVYPSDYGYGYCDRCREQLREADRYGDVMASDWG